MPIYVYKCVSGHEFERRQGFNASPVDVCPVCNSEARRKLFSPAVIYKGSGFYTTDYARKKVVPAGETDGISSNGSSPDSSSNDSHGDAQSPSTNAKAEATTE